MNSEASCGCFCDIPLENPAAEVRAQIRCLKATERPARGERPALKSVRLRNLAGSVESLGPEIKPDRGHDVDERLERHLAVKLVRHGQALESAGLLDGLDDASCVARAECLLNQGDDVRIFACAPASCSAGCWIYI